MLRIVGGIAADVDLEPHQIDIPFFQLGKVFLVLNPAAGTHHAPADRAVPDCVGIFAAVSGIVFRKQRIHLQGVEVEFDLPGDVLRLQRNAAPLCIRIERYGEAENPVTQLIQLEEFSAEPVVAVIFGPIGDPDIDSGVFPDSFQRAFHLDRADDESSGIPAEIQSELRIVFQTLASGGNFDGQRFSLDFCRRSEFFQFQFGFDCFARRGKCEEQTAG